MTTPPPPDGTQTRFHSKVMAAHWKRRRQAGVPPNRYSCSVL